MLGVEQGLDSMTVGERPSVLVQPAKVLQALQVRRETNYKTERPKEEARESTEFVHKLERW